ncbi:hypothetical protein [Longimonas halophila]|uniref:hypothetical protein n=1 Tax=Longimonas halophila TaxID=1469170 RepID=UPI001144CC94|nr:hypothetical protein [Longimonas halophila]
MIRVASVLFGLLLFVTVASISGHEAGETMVSTSCAAVQSSDVRMSSPDCPDAEDWCLAEVYENKIVFYLGQPVTVTP